MNSVPSSPIESRILILRSQRVMLDADLSQLYGVPTKVLVRAVKRNAARFPPDFMFQLGSNEIADLRRQAGTSSSWGGRRYLPYAIRALMTPQPKPGRQIGFRAERKH